MAQLYRAQEFLTCLPEKPPSGSSLRSIQRWVRFGVYVPVLEHRWPSCGPLRAPTPCFPTADEELLHRLYCCHASAFFNKCRNIKKPTTLQFSLCCIWDTSSFTDIKGLARLFLCSQTAQVQHEKKNKIIFKQCQLTAVVKKRLCYEIPTAGLQSFPQYKSNF